MTPLSGKVAIVTGASRGIGKGAAERLAADGASVVVNYNRESTAANELVSATVERFGKIDILLLNAGIQHLKTFDTVTEEDYDAQFNLNVKGAFFLAQKAMPYMQPGGRIMFVSSGMNSWANVTEQHAVYVMTKGAVEQATRSLCKALGPKGITVNTVAPGATTTDMFLVGKSKEVLNGIAALSPFDRLGTPSDIASLVAFLASEESRWVSGQTIRVNGGIMV
ncbi:hypothetical protein DL766_004485 [Monosporascus sp. MC13-8B]|uniref:Uncharacterized protein n=1 Tax=Monosporascus cannonballus TaxID=155416 RepID=A0ABY0H4G6_9PEZI|nr:hypothetical protein DL762_007180 [Monosporascus cannonballus]RYO86138.1 hypothetical protein DL763_006831 [Monosporascus cannonballus]RYP31177.1 hypothetical protein DL766_004485 [Monosporascus sp. MC13-8B]